MRSILLPLCALAALASFVLLGSSGSKLLAGPGDHPEEGPHHGQLIELGKEEYHAELVHDEKAGSVTVYVLDNKAKKAVPIDAPKVLINLTHGGKPEQFPLTAKPDKGDPKGKSSRFVSTDKELAEDLDAKGVKAQLVIVIAGKQFRGDIGHHAHAKPK